MAIQRVIAPVAHYLVYQREGIDQWRRAYGLRGNPLVEVLCNQLKAVVSTQVLKGAANQLGAMLLKVGDGKDKYSIAQQWVCVAA